MLNLTDAHYFVRVVDHGGFAVAARALGLPKSTVSHRIGELEAALGIRLLNRTSRQIAVTQAGQRFYGYARELLDKASRAEEAMRGQASEPGGIVRLTTTPELSEHVLCSLLPVFLRRHPRVSIAEEATDRVVDLVGEGFDLAIRGHNSSLSDSSLIQRHIARAPWVLFAGADYVAAVGLPATPADLGEHAALSLSRPGTNGWSLRGPDGETASVAFVPRFGTNSMISLKRATCAGLGISALPGYICRREIEDGSLVRILPDWTVMDASFSALIPYRSGMPPGVRALLDFLASELPAALAFDVGDGNRSILS